MLHYWLAGQTAYLSAGKVQPENFCAFTESKCYANASGELINITSQASDVDLSSQIADIWLARVENS